MRLWLRLFLALAALSGAALLAFAIWQQHSFRSGFLGYLDMQTLQHLRPVATRLATAYSQHGNWDFLRDRPRRFGDLIESASRDPFARSPPNDAPPLFDAAPPPPPRMQARHADGRFHHRPPPHGQRGLMPRLLLVDAGGRAVAGNPRVPADATAIPVELDGRRIGELRLARLPQISGATDVAFARTQTHSALLAGILVLVGALALAFALARWLLAPVRALGDATRSLAGGDYATRIRSARRDELGALSRDFDRLAETLEQHRRARRQWGTDIAHELRTPLSILRGEVQALQDGVREVTPAALESLAAECERLGHLIEDLYQLSLADAGALEYRFETLDLADIVRESMQLSERACLDAGLVLEAGLSEVPPLRGDARRLGQLLDNLLANARRYTDAPGRIRVELGRRGNTIELTVDDTPPGVPRDALPQLFERLYRVDAARTRSAGGSGLGLAICRAIVEAHGGSIRAQCSPLGGLRVCIELPGEP